MEPRSDVVSQIIARASSPGFEDWWARVEHAGFCSSPVELHGRDASGRPVNILARCKNRRASVCPSCSALYSGDTWHWCIKESRPSSTTSGRWCSRR